MRKAVRDDQITFRISVPLKAALEAAAADAGLELSEHCRRVLIEDTRRRMSQRNTYENAVDEARNRA